MVEVGVEVVVVVGVVVGVEVVVVVGVVVEVEVGVVVVVVVEVEVVSTFMLANASRSLRLAVEGLERMRLDSFEGSADMLAWLSSLDPADAQLLAMGLLLVASRCSDPRMEAEFLMDMDIDLPAPTETVTLAEVQPGDTLFVRILGRNEKRVVTDVLCTTLNRRRLIFRGGQEFYGQLTKTVERLTSGGN